MKKSNLFLYGLISLFVFTISIGQTKASNYENYYGIEMTNQEYNNLLNLGFSSEEIYYMSEDTFLDNKDLTSTLLAKDQKYYKSIYTDLNGELYSVEISKEEYENQGTINPRGYVETEYKTMVTTLSQNGNRYRYKVSLSWKQMPSTRNYDIIGIGFDDPVYISSGVFFNYYHTGSDGITITAADYYDKKVTSTGGSAVYKIPSSARSLSAALWYDVSKNTSATINRLDMYGDYSHATASVPGTNYTNHYITHNGIELTSSIAGYYDSIPYAQSTWTGSW